MAVLAAVLLALALAAGDSLVFLGRFGVAGVFVAGGRGHLVELAQEGTLLYIYFADLAQLPACQSRLFLQVAGGVLAQLLGRLGVSCLLQVLVHHREQVGRLQLADHYYLQLDICYTISISSSSPPAFRRGCRSGAATRPSAS